MMLSKQMTVDGSVKGQGPLGQTNGLLVKS